jgi:prophage maintenance system killer protein
MSKEKQDPVTKKTIIYQTKNGALELKTDAMAETIWFTQLQVAELFDVQKSAISKHVKNIFETEELEYKSTVSKMETVQKEGRRTIKRVQEYYNLDLVLSIGYRINSKKATHFRQWATKTLKEHVLKGYTINPNQIQKNYTQFLKTVDNFKELIPVNSMISKDIMFELITLFADTWLSLYAYDKGGLVTQGATIKKVILTAEKLNKGLTALKRILIEKGQASDIFGIERVKNSIEGIIGNVLQSFNGQELYPSIEEKAAHLLYFIVKNHPFIDGNKRSGAYAFVWFLRQAKILNIFRISPPALTAITLLIAESAPKDKEKMIGLICTLLRIENLTY